MSQNVQKIARAGDVEINDVTIITTRGLAVSVLPQVIGIEVFEDIFSMFISGTLTLRESQSLTNLLPLIGEEVLRLEFKTPSVDETQTYKGEFFIYKMGKRVMNSEREATYTLSFISKEAVTDLNKKVSKAFSGFPSDIMEELCVNQEWGLETPKPVFLENTTNQIKYVSNFWSPAQNIQYVCDHALNESDSPSMIFFETKYGFNFVALDTLYVTGELKQRFVWDNYTVEIAPTSSTIRDIDKDYQRILEIDYPVAYDYMERVQSGLYGSEIISYDIMTHQYTHKVYVPTFSDHSHMNKYPLWDKPMVRPKATILHCRKYYNNFENFGDVTNSRFVQIRKSLLAQAESQKLTVTVFGRTDYSAGQRVLVEIPKAAQITAQNNDWEDKLLTGQYLISACCHVITPGQHTCVLELIKDSFMVEKNVE